MADGARKACRTEKPTRKDNCGCPFRTTRGTQTEKPTRKDNCGCPFRLLRGALRQRNLRERIIVVVLFDYYEEHSDRETYEKG